MTCRGSNRESCRVTYVATGKVTTLKHELGDDTVEAGALVVKGLALTTNTLLTGAEGAEVLSGLEERD